MFYGQKLRELREEAEIKIQYISLMLNFDKDTYGKFEREYKIIPSIHLNTVCNYFNVSIDYVFSFTKFINYSDEKKNIDLKKAGLRLKEFRKKYKLTQNDLAKKLGISQATIVSYEKGKNLIATLFLYDICKKYHVSADYLLGKIDYEPKW